MTMTDAPGLSLDADLKVSLDLLGGSVKRLAEQQERANQLVQQAGLLQPSSRTETAADVCGSTGTLVLDLGGPAQGRLWDVRRIVVGGATRLTAAAGTADVFVSAAGKLQQPGSLLDWADEAATMPLMATYGAAELALRYPEHLFIVINGGTSTQQYLAAARVVDHMDTPTSRVTEAVGA